MLKASFDYFAKYFGLFTEMFVEIGEFSSHLEISFPLLDDVFQVDFGGARLFYVVRNLGEVELIGRFFRWVHLQVCQVKYLPIKDVYHLARVLNECVY